MSTSSDFHKDTEGRDTAGPDPVALTQQLVRFDTTNPPVNETQCIQHIKALLDDSGIQNQVLANTPNRPNLIARLPGDGSASPLLLQGHVDVVPSDPAIWQQPPFSGNLADVYIWDRRSLDMKGGIATMVSAMLRAESEGMMTLVSDEESGGNQGARYMVEQHPEQFQGIKHAIGEFGEFSFNMGSRRFYPSWWPRNRCDISGSLSVARAAMLHWANKTTP